MARIKDREKALTLRGQAMSYSQIRKILKVSKSTLSIWLHDMPLPEEKIRKLQEQGWKKSEAALERFRNTMRQKREERLREIYEIQKKKFLPLSDCSFFVAGLFLYWGEGTKCRRDGLSISNTDPSVIKFFILWLNKSLNIPREKMRVGLHLYRDMDIDQEMRFWSKLLEIPLLQFNRPYIKKTSSERINHKGGFGHGICNLRINSVPIAEKIFMTLKAITDYYQ